MQAESKTIFDKYTRIAKIGAAWNTYLQIDHQSFCVVEQTTFRRAQRYRKNLAIAISRLLVSSDGALRAGYLGLSRDQKVAYHTAIIGDMWNLNTDDLDKLSSATSGQRAAAIKIARTERTASKGLQRK